MSRNAGSALVGGLVHHSQHSRTVDNDINYQYSNFKEKPSNSFGKKLSMGPTIGRASKQQPYQPMRQSQTSMQIKSGQNSQPPSGKERSSSAMAIHGGSAPY